MRRLMGANWPCYDDDKTCRITAGDEGWNRELAGTIRLMTLVCRGDDVLILTIPYQIRSSSLIPEHFVDAQR